MNLITEQTMEVENLIESDGNNKAYYISGVFMQAEKPNKNGRVYHKNILENQLDKYQRVISEKRALGELGHPNSPSINLDKVSHLITNLMFEGNNILGKAKILDTPNGKIAKNFLDEGIKLGVSSRGVGSLINKGGINEVGNDFILITVDIVHEPSGIDCWVNGLMENASWVYNANNDIWELAEDLKRNLQQAKKQEFDNKALYAFHKFLKHI